jgi:hypothetical protein
MSNAFHYQNTFDDALAREFRGVLSVDKLQLFDPFDFWDFADGAVMTLTGDLIDAVANKGRSDDPIVHHGGNQISFAGDSNIGHQYANSYWVGAAGDRNFLHNGSGCEVFIIHKQLAATNEQYLIMSNDIAGNSYVAGQRFSTSQISGLRYYTSRTGYATNHVFSQSGDGTLSLDLPVISHFKLTSGPDADIQIREDGLLVFSMPYNVDHVFSADDHNAPMRVFLGYTGDIYGMVMYDRALDEARRSQVFTNLRRYYGLPSVADITVLMGSSNIDGLGSGAAIPSEYNGIAPGSYIYAYEDGDQAKSLGWWPYEQAHMNFRDFCCIRKRIKALRAVNYN